MPGEVLLQFACCKKVFGRRTATKGRRLFCCNEARCRFGHWELCLKLTGDALQAYSQHFTPDANPTFEEVAAQLAKTFIKPYQGLPAGAQFSASSVRPAARSPDVQSEPAVHADSVHSGSGGTSGPAASPWPEISDIECKLRLARGDRDRSSKPLPEYNGPNSSHEASNRAELAKRRQNGACYACLNSRVQYDLFHLECPQHGRGATHKQRTDKALCAPASSPASTSDGPRPGPAPRQPPYASSV